MPRTCVSRDYAQLVASIVLYLGNLVSLYPNVGSLDLFDYFNEE